MSAVRPKIPEDTRLRQFRASDPHGSAWVSANAGSGKTYVLSQRVVRLLLSGVDPGRILCLTFTKAAAAEMAGRVFRILGDWTGLDEAALDTALAEYLQNPPDEALRKRARCLFAQALETPGGLKIQTIHAFCERVLHQFPFEAEIAGHFSVMEADQSNDLLFDVETACLAAIARKPNSPLGVSLSGLQQSNSDTRIRDALRELIFRRDGFQRWIARSGGLEPALQELSTVLGADGVDTETLVRTSPFGGAFNRQYATGLLADLDAGKANDVKAAARIREALNAPDGEPAFLAYLDIFTRMDGRFRKDRSATRLVTKTVRDSWPDLVEMIAAEQARLNEILDRYNAVRTWTASAALFRIGQAILKEYEWRKTAMGVLDFEDLVVRTAELLSNTEAALWVQYKLDYGIDHILVDEAQDTSPRQWEVIHHLSGDFFSGATASASNRTVFSVGDEKQSIYSFQGAVPHWFSDMRRHFGQRAEGASHRWSDVTLSLSFRSAPDILSAVDAVFSPAPAAMGLADTDYAPHEALRRSEPGLVEIWPEILSEKSDPDDDWLAPIDAVSAVNPAVRMAERIARTISDWLDDNERLEGTGEIIRPGDILILVRKRGPFVRAMVRALKRANVPVAGTDRLALIEDIATLDLLALGDFVLLAEDDLSLAAVLKSPLIGLDEEDLFDLAHDRNMPLWQALERRAGDTSCYGTAYSRLAEWRARADQSGPFDFYSDLLTGDGARRRYKSLFGSDVDDILDEFIARTIAYEKAALAPSLQEFIEWMRRGATEVKREVDQGRDEVRIMTVHGAKGLEAGIVFVVDNGSAPVHSSHRPAILSLEGMFAEPGPPMLWAQSSGEATALQQAALKAADQRQMEEYGRLLYVAMTRARDRLYICGHAGGSRMHDNCWHTTCVSALASGSTEVKAEDGSLVAWRWQTSAKDPVAPKPDAEQTAKPAELPTWIDDPLPAQAERTITIRPSHVLTDLGVPVSSPHHPEVRETSSAIDAAERGTLIHRLLELLPGLDPAERPTAADRVLERTSEKFFQTEREAMAREVLDVLDQSDLAPFFGPTSHAEAEIAGILTDAAGKRLRISGTVDRLLNLPGEVHVLDFKSGAGVPSSSADTPVEYVAQMALYRRVLQEIRPNTPIRCSLLWTSGPKLMELPAEMLESALRNILSHGRESGRS